MSIEPLEVLRQQIVDYDNKGSEVKADQIAPIFLMNPADRTHALYQQVQRFLKNCSLFVSLRQAKVIGDGVIIELIKQMRLSTYESEGAQIFNYGATNSASGSTNI